VTIKNALEVTFRLQFATRLDEETQVHVGFCPLLNLYSQGTSTEEASRAVVSAATLFIAECYKREILGSVLRDRGMTEVATAASAEADQSQFISVKDFSRVFEEDVPLHLLASRHDVSNREAVSCR